MDIDIVIPWVDGNDPAWLQEFNQYAPQKKEISIDISAERYRDTGLLRYWFRGIEKNIPWVRKVFLVTNGQKPDWLNLDNEKLCFVTHEDYIPHAYLPTFSSRAINMYTHRIQGLSDHFILFDDDMYMLNPVEKDYFFKKGLPRDYAVLCPIKRPDFYIHVTINDMIEINNHFKRHEVMKKNLFKFFNYRYPLRRFVSSCYISRLDVFPGFIGHHSAQAFLRETFEDVWQHCGEALEATARNRFRSIADVNIYLFRYWQLVKGNFFPQKTVSIQRQFFKVAASNIHKIGKTIGNRRVKELCLNDTDCSDDCYTQLITYFDKKFPEKSSFELP